MRSRQLSDLDEYTQTLRGCVEHALTRLAAQGQTGAFGQPIGLADVRVTCFEQTWPSTALGFPGGGGRAMTAALTVLVEHAEQALVYHGGRFAYQAPREQLAERIADRVLPGVLERSLKLTPDAKAPAAGIARWLTGLLGERLAAYTLGLDDTGPLAARRRGRPGRPRA